VSVKPEGSIDMSPDAFCGVVFSGKTLIPMELQ
jgi:hypothetical protein